MRNKVWWLNFPSPYQLALSQWPPSCPLSYKYSLFCVVLAGRTPVSQCEYYLPPRFPVQRERQSADLYIKKMKSMD